MHITKFQPMQFVQQINFNGPVYKGYVYWVHNDIFFQSNDQIFVYELATDSLCTCHLNPFTICLAGPRISANHFTLWDDDKEKFLLSKMRDKTQLSLLS